MTTMKKELTTVKESHKSGFMVETLYHRDEEVEEEDEAEAKNPTGGIPILRTASESGRAMAIPMKSRQSSNDSNDYRDVRTHAVKALSNPKWDTEAAL